MLAMFQAVVGQFYVAVVVALFVGMYSSQPRAQGAAREDRQRADQDRADQDNHTLAKIGKPTHLTADQHSKSDRDRV
jgi:hypothetical protein